MRASERAYEALLHDIQNGSLAPGTVLGEALQASRLGVSRTPLREALARLTTDGLVEQVSPRVTVVTEVHDSGIRELFEVRRALEEAAARLAASRADTATFASLAEEFAAAQPGVDVESYYALIARFDEAMDDAVANHYLSSALRTVRTHLVRVRRLSRDNPVRLAASVAEHRQIAAAIAAGDGELAAHATHIHLHNALAAILETMRGAEIDTPGAS